MARMKPTPMVVTNRDEAVVALGEIACLDRELARIEADMQEAIDQAKEKARQAAAGYQERRAALADGVAVYARLTKAELFREGRSVDLGYGVIGFRASTAIVQERGVTAEMSLLKCHELGLAEGVRVREELDKRALLQWPDERLALIGVKRQQRDTFFIEINEEQIPEGGA